MDSNDEVWQQLQTQLELMNTSPDLLTHAGPQGK